MWKLAYIYFFFQKEVRKFGFQLSLLRVYANFPRIHYAVIKVKSLRLVLMLIESLKIINVDVKLVLSLKKKSLLKKKGVLLEQVMYSSALSFYYWFLWLVRKNPYKFSFPNQSKKPAPTEIIQFPGSIILFFFFFLLCNIYSMI